MSVPRPPRPSLGGAGSRGTTPPPGREGRPQKLKIHTQGKASPRAPTGTGPANKSGRRSSGRGLHERGQQMLARRKRGSEPGVGLRSRVSSGASSAVQAAKQAIKRIAKQAAKQAIKQGIRACLAAPHCWIPVLWVLVAGLALVGVTIGVAVTFIGTEMDQLGGPAEAGHVSETSSTSGARSAEGLALPEYVEPQNWRLPAQMLDVSDGWTAVSSQGLLQQLEKAALRSEVLREAAHSEALAAAALVPPPPTVTAPQDEAELWVPGPGHDACAAAASLAPESARWETPELIGEDGSLPSSQEFAAALNSGADPRWCPAVVAAKIVWDNAPPLGATDTAGACGEACVEFVDAGGRPKLVALPPPRLRDWAKRVLPLAVTVQQAPVTVWGRMTDSGPTLCAHQPSSLPDEIRDMATEHAPDGRILLRLRVPCQAPPPVCVPQPPSDDDAIIPPPVGCVPDLVDWEPPHPAPSEEPRRPPFGAMARVSRDTWTLQERDIDAAPGMLMLLGAALDIGAFDLTDPQRRLLAGMVTASQSPLQDPPDVTAEHWETLLVAAYGVGEKELSDGWMGRTDAQGRELGLCHWLPRLVAGASCAEESPLAPAALRVLWGSGTSASVPIPGYVPGEGCPDVPPAPWRDLDTSDVSRLVAVPNSWRDSAVSGQIYLSPCLIDLLAALIAESERSMPEGPLRIVSGYRSVTTQERLYTTRGCSPGQGCRWGPLTARPGYSMHHTGQAVDFNVPTEGERFQWLAARLLQHGLTPLTSGSGQVIEPWHWSTNSR
ncbi:MAG: hypothetical protein F4Z31_01780 [Gemmatimonadetes bacterium]|nr:hypothetical protein [Gemmatimonadota bacterium]